jgi:hypothetical protein
MDLSSVIPVALKSPTVLGNDPFNASKSEQAAIEIKNFRESGKAAPLDNRTPPSKPSTPDGPEPPRVQALRPGDIPQPTRAPAAQPALPKLDF